MSKGDWWLKYQLVKTWHPSEFVILAGLRYLSPFRDSREWTWEGSYIPPHEERKAESKSQSMAEYMDCIAVHVSHENGRDSMSLEGDKMEAVKKKME